MIGMHKAFTSSIQHLYHRMGLKLMYGLVLHDVSVISGIDDIMVNRALSSYRLIRIFRVLIKSMHMAPLF